jgi:membrane fusion protein, multidrug efflux system
MKSDPRLPIAAAALLAAAAASCSKPPPMGFERPPAPVVVVAALEQDVPVYLDKIGKCAAREVVSVRPQVSGRITAIHFADGADLKAGDPLFTIDPRPFQAALDAAESERAQTEAVLGLAKAELERVEGIEDTRAVSQQQIDIRKNAVEVAQARLAEARASVEKAKLDLEYCEIRSPLDGRAGQRLVDVGNVLNSSDSPVLVVIQRLDPVYAEFTVAESDLTAVQRNMKEGRLKVEVRIPGEPEEPRTGELTFLDNAVQEASGTIKLRATVPNPDHRLWPGRFLEVRLVLRTLAGAVLVPATAPQMSAKGAFVYVVKDDGKAELRPVTTGQRQGELVVVSEGLQAGERVVVVGQLGVMPGGPVRVVEPEAKKEEGAPKSASPAPKSAAPMSAADGASGKTAEHR